MASSLHRSLRFTLAVAITAALVSACTNDSRPSSSAANSGSTAESATSDSNALATNTATTGSSDTAALATGTKPLLQVADEAGLFSVFLSLVAAADLESKLGEPGPFTVFAPTDQAFAKLPPDIVARLLLPENKTTLQSLLRYQILGGVKRLGELSDSDIDTLEGSKVKFAFVKGSLEINGATIEPSDIAASNGILHGIDSVVSPPTISLNALTGNVTVADTTPQDLTKPFIETITSTGTFSTLIAAVKASGIDDVFTGPGPFTVFAPSDDAFARLPKEVLRKLLLPANRDALVQILKHHVTAARVTGADLKDKGQLKMLDGTMVTVLIASGKISVDSARMTRADEYTTNGVYHVLDSVLLPKATDLTLLVG
jgi:transforming growth factor-beta-induced protein